MPDIDLSEVWLDSDVAGDTFSVIRRPYTLTKGRTVITPAQTDGIFGSVNSASPEDLKRLEDYQVGMKVVSIVTGFRLQMQSPSDGPGNKGYQPDIVIWHGSHFVVSWLDDYSSFGNGQIQALATSIDYNDPPPRPAP